MSLSEDDGISSFFFQESDSNSEKGEKKEKKEVKRHRRHILAVVKVNMTEYKTPEPGPQFEYPHNCTKYIKGFYV